METAALTRAALPHPGFIAETRKTIPEMKPLTKVTAFGQTTTVAETSAGPARPENNAALHPTAVAMAGREEPTGSWRAILKGWKATTAIQSRTGDPGIEREALLEKKARRRLLPWLKRFMIEKAEGCER